MKPTRLFLCFLLTAITAFAASPTFDTVTVTTTLNAPSSFTLPIGKVTGLSSNVVTLLGAANFAAFKSSLSLNAVENTALSTWGGSSNITTLGTIGAGTWNATPIGTSKGGAPTGGTTGQVLTKNSGTSYDYSWATPSGGGGGGGDSDLKRAVVNSTTENQTITAVANTHYVVVMGDFRVTFVMPSSPEIGDTIIVDDTMSHWGHEVATSGVTVDRPTTINGGNFFGVGFQFPLDSCYNRMSHDGGSDYWAQDTPPNRERRIVWTYRAIPNSPTTRWVATFPAEVKYFGSAEVAYVSSAGYDVANAVTGYEPWATGEKDKPYLSLQEAINNGATRIHLLSDDAVDVVVHGNLSLTITSEAGAVIGAITVDQATSVTLVCADKSIRTGAISITAGDSNGSLQDSAAGGELSVVLRGFCGDGATATITGEDGNAAAADDGTGGVGGSLNGQIEDMRAYAWTFSPGLGGANGASNGGNAAAGGTTIKRRFSTMSAADNLLNGATVTDQSSFAIP